MKHYTLALFSLLLCWNILSNSNNLGEWTEGTDNPICFIYPVFITIFNNNNIWGCGFFFVFFFGCAGVCLLACLFISVMITVCQSSFLPNILFCPVPCWGEFWKKCWQKKTDKTKALVKQKCTCINHSYLIKLIIWIIFSLLKTKETLMLVFFCVFCFVLFTFSTVFLLSWRYFLGLV